MQDSPNTSANDHRFTADPEDGRIVVMLDVLGAVYHRQSGTTHILGEPAPHLLSLLGGERLTLDQMLEKLSAEFDIGPIEVARAALEARIAELEAAGLVWRV